MSVRISRYDIIWNYAGSILNLGTGIFVLPVVLRMLTIQEIGLWYVFASISGLITLLDFGFAPNIMRNITYSWCGAQELMREGISLSDKKDGPNYALIKSLVQASRKLYLIIALIAGVLLVSAGTYYIYSLLPTKDIQYLIAWLLYLTAVLINIYYSYWSPLLKGIGAVKEANQAIIVSRMIYVFGAPIGLFLGGGLIWLSLMFLISGLVLRILSKIYFLKAAGVEYQFAKCDTMNSFKKVFSILWHNSKKLGIVMIGGWLITNSTTLMCSTYLGLEITATYGLSLQLLNIIGSFSSLLFSSYIPDITSSKIRNDFQRYNQIFSRAITVQWFIGLIGIICLIMIGPSVLSLIGSKAKLLPTDMLLLMGLILFLEWNHSSFATLITLSNTVPFVGASIYSGMSILALSLILIHTTELGLLGIISAQGLVQLAYNNWYWPRLVLRENHLSVLQILKSAFNDFLSLKLIKRRLS